MILFLFTSFYPYDSGAEYAFLQHELPHLIKEFERIILVPRICKGKMLPLPAGVEVNNRYTALLQCGLNPGRIFGTAFASQWFFREIGKRPAILLDPSKILKLILFLSRAELTKRWVKDFIQIQHLDPSNCVLYSYWFDHTTAGFAMLKQEFPSTKIVSRAHGYDIYEEYYYPYYWPCRDETLNALDTLFFASDAGRTYLCDRYPEYVSKFETSHLGTADPGFVTPLSPDGVFRIVSCAHIVPVKRLGLLLDGIASAARLRPEQKFEWIHFGDGKERNSLIRRMNRIFPSNARGQFVGYVPNREIIQYYKKHPFDVFLNISSTEGGVPVSIQEATSCGIPIIATSVGGNPEIVSDEKNGFLLDPNPAPEQIAAALLRIWDNPTLAAEMRKESRQAWQTGYNADVNFQAFAERLKSIGEN